MDKLETWLQDWRNTITASAKHYEGDTLRAIFYMDMLHNLDAVQHWSEQGDTEKAVLWTAAFAQSVQQASKVIELPALISSAYSKQQSNIASIPKHDITPERARQLVDELLARSSMSKTAAFKQIAKEELDNASAYKTIERRYNTPIFK